MYKDACVQSELVVCQVQALLDVVADSVRLHGEFSKDHNVRALSEGSRFSDNSH